MDPQAINPEVVDSAPNSAQPAATTNSDMLVKAIVIWVLAPIGGLFFLNETDVFVVKHVRQSLVLGLLTLIVAFIPCFGAVVAVLIFIFKIYMAIKMNNKESMDMPGIDDIVKMIWKN